MQRSHWTLAAALFAFSTTARAIVPSNYASLIFPEQVTIGTQRLVVYEWDFNQWKLDSTLTFSVSNTEKIIPYPGAKDFAILEYRSGASRQVLHVNALGIQKVSAVKALGHTFDGYPLELTDSDDIIEYNEPKNEQTIVSTLAPSIPVWGPGKFHLIGQFRNRDYILAGDRTIAVFDGQQTSAPHRLDLSKLSFKIPDGPSGLHRIQNVWDMLPANAPNAWLIVGTDQGALALIAIDLKSDKILDVTHLAVQNPSSAKLIELQPGYAYKSNQPTGEVIYQVDDDLRQRDADTNRTVNLKFFFSPLELQRNGVPASQFAVHLRSLPIAWNWRADYYGYSYRQGTRAKSTPMPPQSPSPRAQQTQLQLNPTPVTPAQAPAAVATPTQNDLAVLVRLPEQMTRKQFIQIFKNADPMLKAVLTWLLKPEADNALSRLGLSRYHSTFECVGSENGIITREQLTLAIAQTCMGRLLPRP